jgi:hypothetical protein
MRMATMNISLPDPITKWIEERIRSGQVGVALQQPTSPPNDGTKFDEGG